MHLIPHHLVNVFTIMDYDMRSHIAPSQEYRHGRKAVAIVLANAHLGSYAGGK
jgi:hypothetical protein